MPIEFECQACHRLMRTPDSAAGKKGRCPHCGELTRIPQSSQTSASESERRLAPSATVTSDSSAEGGKTSGRIEFPCPKCGRPVRTPGSAAGKKGKCPNCGVVVQIPLSSETLPERQAAAKKAKQSAKPAAQERKGGSAIEFPCPKCRKSVRTPASAAGKKGKCPKCGAVLKIPASKSSSARAAKQRSAGLSPLPDTSPGLSPLSDDEPGLMPLGQGAAGLTPLADDMPGLAPLSDDLSGLTPLGDDTGGLTPLADNSPSLAPLADDAAGLTPLSGDSPGLTLLPEDSGGLTPVPDIGGLTPMAGDAGLTPLGSDPLATAQPGLQPISSPGAGNANPFSDAYAPASPPAYAPNPYQAPSYAPRRRTGVNEWVIKAPAIAMMVVSGLSIAVMVPYLIFVAVGAARGGPGGPGNEAEMIGFAVGMIMFILIAVAVPGFTIFAAWKMLKLESWGLALTAAILTIVSGLCCGIGFPVGIWALVVLCLSDVRNAFD